MLNESPISTDLKFEKYVYVWVKMRYRFVRVFKQFFLTLTQTNFSQTLLKAELKKNKAAYIC